MSDGPDFICIGMQKAGTGWLFDQLQYHPDYWMPPTKEIHYLDKDPPRLRNATNLLDKARNQPNKLENRFQHRRRWDERDMEFLELAETLSGQPLSLDSYASLFRFKRDLRSGDVTPGYSGLDEDIISKIVARFPETRIVYLVRDPVSRIWSQISMSARNDNFNVEMLERPEKFKKYINRSDKFPKVAFPAKIAARWDKAAPNAKFRHFFFDDIAANPVETRRDIFNFIGGDPDKQSGELSADHNKKSEAVKLTLTDDIKAVLVEFMADELRACAKRFGGHAIGWAEKYGISP